VSTSKARPARATPVRRPIGAALVRFRVVAYVVGVVLLVLVFVGVPLNHLAHQPAVVAVVGPVHGFLYIVYLLTTLDLAFRGRWPLPRTVLVMLAGTIPFLSFVAERKVTHLLRGD
jgi:integral membrane protein